MYCSKCGSELPPEAAFCSKCGSRVWQQPGGVTTQTERSNPPGGMGQNGSSTWTPPQEPDLGYTRIFGYKKSTIIFLVIMDVISVLFLSWLCNKIEDISYFGSYDGVLALLMIVMIFYVIFSGYQIFKQTRIKLEVGANGINGTAGVGFQWFLFSSTSEVMISYKDIDNVGTFMDANDPSAGIKILSDGTWYHFSIENGKEAFDLIRQRWQAARR